MIAGIAGVNPYIGTLGTVGFARYAVQAGLAYELDARQIPDNWTTGYFLQGTTQPGQTTTEIYGTEVFEVSIDSTPSVNRFAEYSTLKVEYKSPRCHYWLHSQCQAQ